MALLETPNYLNKQDFFPKDKNGLYLNNTNDLQQSRFLPLLQNAENAIKKLITKYVFGMKSLYDLRNVINLYIVDFEKNRLPKDILNRNSYIRGLYQMANKVYDELIKQRREFAVILGLLTTNLIALNIKPPKIQTPIELSNFITKNKDKIKYDMWVQAKAAVRVQDYPKKIEEYIKKASEIPTLAIEDGKKPISIWQKAELDIRYEHQMKMVQDAIDSGDDLWFISSHPDCSKRCEKWQGKLVSVTRHKKMSGFRIEKVDGMWVYSLPDIMDQVDKYGYHNTIIKGFNCRHYLIKYEKGKLPPKEYSKEDVKKMREISEKIRSMEREIRQMKTDLGMLKQGGKLKEAAILENKIKKAIKFYRDFCNKNGFASEMYRV